uniref:Uncharacterized protein n=1 Tax=Picea glauca TaxID=3330 RepID=A0A101M2J1_PICGL|nr:hypothetical protein ABT39_MTgene2984 [Picea glauca]
MLLGMLLDLLLVARILIGQIEQELQVRSLPTWCWGMLLRCLVVDLTWVWGNEEHRSNG